jgi:hypothetical protein
MLVLVFIFLDGSIELAKELGMAKLERTWTNPGFIVFFSALSFVSCCIALSVILIESGTYMSEAQPCLSDIHWKLFFRTPEAAAFRCCQQNPLHQSSHGSLCLHIPLTLLLSMCGRWWSWRSG